MTAIAKAPALTLPSEITEPGWYWAEERIEDDGDGNDYQLTVLNVETRLSDAALCFSLEGVIYDAAAADAWFRIVRRIEEPEIRGGWA